MHVEQLMEMLEGQKPKPRRPIAKVLPEIIEYFAALQKKHLFTPGQIIIAKAPELCGWKDANEPRLFAGYLEEPIHASDYCDASNLGSAFSALVFDCKVSWLEPEGYVEWFADSREFKPYQQ